MDSRPQPSVGARWHWPAKADLGRLLLVAIGYFAAHKLSYLVQAAGGSIAAIWPASGIALSAMLLCGRRLWWPVLAVTLGANFLIEMFEGRRVVVELGFVLANLVETGGSAWFITRWAGRPVTFRRLDEVLALGVVAIGVNGLSAAIGAASVLLESSAGFWGVYRAWWVADGLGLLLLTPVLVAWFRPRGSGRAVGWRELVEWGLIVVVAGAMAWEYFGPTGGTSLVEVESYMLILPLVWAALRMSARGATAVLGMMGLFEVVVTAAGWGALPLGGEEVAGRVLRVQLFVGMQCAVFLLLAASFAERRETEVSLRKSIDALQQAREELRRLNRALRTISDCNQVMVRSADEATLLDSVCRVIVADGGHRFAVVGFLEEAAERGLREAARAGDFRGFAARFESGDGLGQQVSGRHLIQRAIDTGRAVVVPEHVVPDADGASAGPPGSSVAVPLKSGNVLFGGLLVHAREPHAFDEAEVGLMTELADDLAYGIQGLRETRRKEAAEREIRDLLAVAERSRAELLRILEEQRRGDEALRASEEQFRSAMENSSIGMALVAPDGRWMEVNRALCRIVGYSREELLATDSRSITHPDDQDHDAAEVARMLAGARSTYEREKRYLHKEGQAVWVHWNTTLLRNADGTPRHFVSQFLDISQRRQADQERVNLVRDLGERVKELTVLHRTARLLQEDRPIDRGLFHEIAEILPEGFEHPESCAVQVCFEGFSEISPGWRETTACLTAEFRVRDGGVGFLRVAHLGGLRPDGTDPFRPEKLALLQSVADLLTASLERKAAEVALRSVNERYARHEEALSRLSGSYALRPEDLSGVLRRITEVVARALEVERVSVWVLDEQRRSIRCLELFERSLDRHSQGAELQRAGHEAYFEALDESEIIASASARSDPRTFALGAEYLGAYGIESMLDAPIHARGRTAGVLCCEHAGSARAWTADEQTFAVAAANLLSMVFVQLEQQRLESQLRHAQKLEALGTLAGGIAHDFNNILGAIVAYTELMRLDHADDAELQANLGEVLRASQRAGDLVRQILAFSRREQPRRKVIRVSAVVREALRLIRSTLPSTIAIDADLPDELPPVLADSTQIHQVVMNLCANAAHAMRGSQGSLRVRLDHLPGSEDLSAPAATRGWLRLTVSDTGHGMDEGTIERIFDPFYTTKEPGEGTGLGLAVVYGIVQEHQGKVHVESAPNLGTTFQILLPVVGATEGLPSAGEASAPRGRGGRVLCVDDEAALAEATRQVLEQHGFRADAVVHPGEALAWVAREPDCFAAVVADLTMPVMSGLELARALKRLHPGLPVFILTAQLPEHDHAAILSEGLAELVLKPVDPAELARRVEAAIHGHVEAEGVGPEPSSIV